MSTSHKSARIWTSFALASRLRIKWASRFCLISEIRFTAFTVFCISSRSYLTGLISVYKVSNCNILHISAFLKLQRGIASELLAICLAIGLGPADLARIALLLEGFVTFGAAESKLFTVVSHKHNAMAGVDGPRAKVALFNAHESISKKIRTLDKYLNLTTAFQQLPKNGNETRLKTATKQQLNLICLFKLQR